MSEQQTEPRSRIRRDTQNGMVGGVAAGFARHLDVDVVWIRLAFVLTTVFGGGIGLVVYLASWLVIPDADGSERRRRAGSPDERDDTSRGGAFWIGVALIALGGVVLLDRLLGPFATRLGWTSPRDVVLPLVLIGIGVLVYRSSRSGGSTAPVAGTAGSVAARIEGNAESLGQRIEHRVEDLSDEVERVTDDWERRAEERSAARLEAGADARVAPITFGAALITLGGLWLAGSLGVPGITLTRTLAATLLVIGTGLVVGAFVGRGRGLMPAGVLLAVAVTISFLAAQVPGRIGMMSIGDDGVIVTADEQRTLSPASLADLPPGYELGVGSVVIDLSALADDVAQAGTVRLTVEMGIGDLRVRLPDRVAADVRVEVGIGRIALPGGSTGGLGVSDRLQLAASDDAPGLLVVEIRQGIGNVTVTR